MQILLDIATDSPSVNSPFNMVVGVLLLVVIAIFVIVAAKKRK